MPWTGVDATLAAAQTVVALQQIVARNVNLTQGMGVITVGKLQACLLYTSESTFRTKGAS